MNRLVLVLNCGSSSLKFSIIDVKNNKKIIFGRVESILSSKSYIIWSANNIEYKNILKKNITYSSALNFILNNILKKDIKLFSNITAIGHRVVHGGSKLINSVIVNDKIIEDITDASCFAPLHNPINLLGIQCALNVFPHLSNKNVAVFDTSFHTTIPEHAYLYAIPYHFYINNGVRRYGAHGINHQYISIQSAKILNKSLKKINIISCHLGNGASISAIRKGICIDTSMGFTPLEGLVMGTRSGDIDPEIIFFMYKKLGISLNEIHTILTKESGLLGLNGVSSDCRYAEKNYYTDVGAKRSIDVFCYRLSKYIAAYNMLMKGKLDAIVFTGGIGENSSLIRDITISQLSVLNFNIDKECNMCNTFDKYIYIHSKDSLPILVIRSNEEWMIAKETISLLNLKHVHE